jgi:hypothetical protein
MSFTPLQVASLDSMNTVRVILEDLAPWPCFLMFCSIVEVLCRCCVCWMINCYSRPGFFVHPWCDLCFRFSYKFAASSRSLLITSQPGWEEWSWRSRRSRILPTDRWRTPNDAMDWSRRRTSYRCCVTSISALSCSRHLGSWHSIPIAGS